MGFPEALVDAATARGSMLAVAERLGVAPQTVYRWIAGTENPGPEECRNLETRLEGALQRRAAVPSPGRRWKDRGPALL